MHEPSESGLAPRSSSARILLLWVAFGLGFGPVFLDVARHLAEHPWSRYALLFPLLFLRTSLRDPGGCAPRADGWLLVAAGMLVLAYAALTATFRIGRLAAGLTALGLCRSLGIGPRRAQPLLLFAVPMPGTIASLGSPELPGALLGWAQSALAPLGLPSARDHLVLVFRQGSLALDPYDGGLALLAPCVGLAWYLALMRRLAWLRTVASLVLAGALAPVLQLGCIVAAALCTALGLSRPGGWLVAHEWIVVALPVIVLAELAPRRGPS